MSNNSLHMRVQSLSAKSHTKYGRMSGRMGGMHSVLHSDMRGSIEEKGRYEISSLLDNSTD